MDKIFLPAVVDSIQQTAAKLLSRIAGARFHKRARSPSRHPCPGGRPPVPALRFWRKLRGHGGRYPRKCGSTAPAGLVCTGHKKHVLAPSTRYLAEEFGKFSALVRLRSALGSHPCPVDVRDQRLLPSCGQPRHRAVLVPPAQSIQLKGVEKLSMHALKSFGPLLTGPGPRDRDSIRPG